MIILFLLIITSIFFSSSSSLQVSIMASRRALKAVLIDLSGTLHIEDVAVPGAQEALNRSEQACANNSRGGAIAVNPTCQI